MLVTTGDPLVRETVGRLRSVFRRSAGDQQNGHQDFIGGEGAAGRRGWSFGEGSESDLLVAAPDVSYVFTYVLPSMYLVCDPQLQAVHFIYTGVC